MADSAVETVEKTQNNSVAFSDALLAHHDIPIGLDLPTTAELKHGHREDRFAISLSAGAEHQPE